MTLPRQECEQGDIIIRKGVTVTIGRAGSFYPVKNGGNYCVAMATSSTHWRTPRGIF